MTNFNYSWKVTDANDTYKNMLVEYSLEGYPTFTMSMPLPTENITLDQRVQQYAPIAQWEYAMISPVSVEVGTTGSNSFTVSEPFSQNVTVSSDEGTAGSTSATAA